MSSVIPLEEYLSSSYRPDCDFVDGQSEERNVGTFNHSRIVTLLICNLSDIHEPWKVLALPSLRMRVADTRVRVPDVCVIERTSPNEQILTHPPLVAIEVLDEEDRFSVTMRKLDDYLRFGIQNIWVINPESRHAYRYTAVGLEEVQTGEITVPETPIRVALSELFAELDRA